MGKGGRKPIYDISSLKIGDKMALSAKIARFKDQYLHHFRKMNPGMNLVTVTDGKKVYIKRLASDLATSTSPEQAQRA